MTKHGDQGVDAEAVDLATGEIADAGLGYPENICGPDLGESTILDKLAEFDHQVCADTQMLRLFRSKADIREYVVRQSSALPYAIDVTTSLT